MRLSEAHHEAGHIVAAVAQGLKLRPEGIIIKNLDAVIWTALESNFQEKTGQPFSVGAMLSHLKTLTPEGKVKTAEYIWRAPEFVKTPVRTALQKEPWFSDAGSA